MSAVTQRENIGSVGIHRSDSSMAGRSSCAVVAHRVEHVRALQQRGERDAHLLPRGARAGREQQQRERVDLGVGEPVRHAVVVGVLGLDQHADEVVLGCSRRAATMGSSMSTTFMRIAHERLAGCRAPARRGTPKLPVMVSTGMAAQKSTLSSARPSSTNPSMSRCTVSSIQFVDPPLRLGRHERRLHERAVAPVLGPAHRQHAVRHTRIVGSRPALGSVTRRTPRGRGTRRRTPRS